MGGVYCRCPQEIPLELLDWAEMVERQSAAGNTAMQKPKGRISLLMEVMGRQYGVTFDPSGGQKQVKEQDEEDGDEENGQE